MTFKSLLMRLGLERSSLFGLEEGFGDYFLLISRLLELIDHLVVDHF